MLLKWAVHITWTIGLWLFDKLIEMFGGDYLMYLFSRLNFPQRLLESADIAKCKHLLEQI